MTMRVRAASLLAALAVAAVGCRSTSAPSAGEAAPAVTTSLPADRFGLAATLEQYREDEVLGLIQIQVVNQSNRAVRLSDVRLVWPGLRDGGPGAAGQLINPGQIIDLPVPLGDAVCGEPPRAEDRPPAAAAVATALASWPEGGSERVQIPITDQRGVLARVFRPGCTRQSVSYTVSVSFDARWSEATAADGAPVASGVLRLHRERGDAEVTVTGLNGSVLLSIEAAPPVGDGAPEALVSLPAGQPEATLGVVVRQSGRCDPHALAESKHTFVLPVVLRVGDAAPVSIDVMPDDAAKAQLGRMINRACGVG